MKMKPDQMKRIGSGVEKIFLDTVPKVRRPDPHHKSPAIQGKINPATRFVHPGTGPSTIVEDIIGDVFHVG